ncbi:MAG: hypothetical protein KKB63_15705 [Alphaproteobacteria bacterium]|nr:hypothetical protein [Alphaproteobacteria bacterium]
MSFKTPNTPVPNEISLVLGDALHNLRSALDIMLVECFKARKKGTSGVKFPFAEDAVKLDEIIKKSLNHGGEDICRLIRSMKPYKGGNINLRGLHDLDISDKHKMLIAAPRKGLYHQIEFVFIINGNITTRIKDGKVIEDKSLPSTIIKSFEVKSIIPENLETTSIVFSESTPFPQKPVIEILKEICKLVDEILDAFEGILVST